MPPSLSTTALLIIDYQLDFLPPGPLAIPTGPALLPTLNALLTLPFRLTLATQDWHPPSHASFASTHAHRPTVTLTNPRNPAERTTVPTWPNHCIQHSPGAALHPDLHAHRLTRVIRKGTDARTEMFSAFRDVFRAPPGGDSELEAALREAGVRTVWVAGLASEYCVKWTALDAAALGFETVVVREAVAGLDRAGDGGAGVEREMEAQGVRVRSLGELGVVL